MSRLMVLLAVGCAAAALAALSWIMVRAPATVAPPALPAAGLPDAVREALEAASAAVRESPTAGHWGRLAMLFSAHQMDSEAIACFDVARGLDPENPRWWYGAATVEHDHDHSRAAEAYREVVRLAPDNAAAWYHLGRVLAHLGEGEEAEASLRRVTALLPDTPLPLLTLARLRLAGGELAEAKEMLERALPLPGSGADVAQELARICRRTGDEERAAVLAEMAARREPLSRPVPDPWTVELRQMDLSEKASFERANRLAKGKRFAEAELLYRQVVEADPENGKARVYLGSCLLGLERIDEARQALLAATERFPGDAEGWALLAIVESRRQQHAEAAAAARHAVRIAPEYAAAWYGLGMTLKELGQFAEAAESFRRCVALQPENGDAAFARGLALEECGRGDEAVEAYRAAVAIAPARVPPRILLAVALIRRGDLAGAELHLKEASRLAPTEPMLEKAWEDWRKAEK